MTNFRIAAAAAISTAILAGPVLAQVNNPVLTEIRGLRDTQNWTIYTNSGLGDGCLASANFTDGTEVRMGINNLNNERYIALLNDAWTDAINTKDVKIELDIDGEVYETVGTEIDKFGRHGAVAYFSGDGVLRDIAGRGIMTFKENDETKATILLSETVEAIAGIQECKAILD